MFARFDENPAMTLQAIKETKRYGRTHGRTHRRTDGQREISIPTTNKVCGGYKETHNHELLQVGLVGRKKYFFKMFFFPFESRIMTSIMLFS